MWEGANEGEFIITPRVWAAKGIFCFHQEHVKADGGSQQEQQQQANHCTQNRLVEFACVTANSEAVDGLQARIRARKTSHCGLRTVAGLRQEIRHVDTISTSGMATNRLYNVLGEPFVSSHPISAALAEHLRHTKKKLGDHAMGSWERFSLSVRFSFSFSCTSFRSHKCFSLTICNWTLV